MRHEKKNVPCPCLQISQTTSSLRHRPCMGTSPPSGETRTLYSFGLVRARRVTSRCQAWRRGRGRARSRPSRGARPAGRPRRVRPRLRDVAALVQRRPCRGRAPHSVAASPPSPMPRIAMRVLSMSGRSNRYSCHRRVSRCRSRSPAVSPAAVLKASRCSPAAPRPAGRRRSEGRRVGKEGRARGAPYR